MILLGDHQQPKPNEKINSLSFPGFRGLKIPEWIKINKNFQLYIIHIGHNRDEGTVDTWIKRTNGKTGLRSEWN